MTTLYETDFYAWTQRQSALLRQEEFAEVDWRNLIEEIESLGRHQQNELRSRLEVLIMHLLKWQWQPEHQSRSWRSTINVQRRDLDRLLDENPSLRSRLPDLLPKAYRRACKDAFDEMGLLRWRFPAESPYTIDQILDEAFWPEV